MGQSRPLFFVYFCPFPITISKYEIEKSVDGVLGIRTHSRMMAGADNTTELWRPPYILPCLLNSTSQYALEISTLSMELSITGILYAELG